MNKKYYFYCYYRITEFGTTIENDVSDIHPFKAMNELFKWYDNESFTLINWREISENEYKYFLKEDNNL